MEGGGGEAFHEFAIVLDESIVVIFGDFEGVEEGEGGIAGNVESVGDGSGMEALRGVAVGLFEEFAAEEDCGGGAVSCYLVLCVVFGSS